MAESKPTPIGKVAEDIIRGLPPIEAKTLVLAIIDWNRNGIRTAPEGVNIGVWCAVKGELERLENSYQKKRDAGRAGGLAAHGGDHTEQPEAEPSRTEQNRAKPSKAEQPEAERGKPERGQPIFKVEVESQSGIQTDTKSPSTRPSRPPARSAPAQAREAGGQPPEPPATFRREISSPISTSPETPPQADDDEPFPDEEPPGTQGQHATVAGRIEASLAQAEKTREAMKGQPVRDMNEWYIRDPIEATKATFGMGAWASYIQCLGMKRYLEVVVTYWSECQAGENKKIKNHAANLTARLNAAIRAGNGGAK